MKLDVKSIFLGLGIGIVIMLAMGARPAYYDRFAESRIELGFAIPEGSFALIRDKDDNLLVVNPITAEADYVEYEQQHVPTKAVRAPRPVTVPVDVARVDIYD